MSGALVASAAGMIVSVRSPLVEHLWKGRRRSKTKERQCDGIIPGQLQEVAPREKRRNWRLFSKESAPSSNTTASPETGKVHASFTDFAEGSNLRKARNVRKSPFFSGPIKGWVLAREQKACKEGTKARSEWLGEKRGLVLKTKKKERGENDNGFREFS